MFDEKLDENIQFSENAQQELERSREILNASKKIHQQECDNINKLKLEYDAAPAHKKRTLNKKIKKAENLSKELELCVKKNETKTEKYKQSFEELPALKRLKTELENSVKKQMGIRKEKDDIDAAEKTMGLVTERNASLMFKRIPGVPRIVLCGKIDGKDEFGGVVESKHRKNRLFRRVVDYEKAQVHAYMFLTQTQNIDATLIETYQGQSLHHTILWDQAFWDKMVDELKKFEKAALEIELEESLLKELENLAASPLQDIPDCLCVF